MRINYDRKVVNCYHMIKPFLWNLYNHTWVRKVLLSKSANALIDEQTKFTFVWLETAEKSVSSAVRLSESKRDVLNKHSFFIFACS